MKKIYILLPLFILLGALSWYLVDREKDGGKKSFDFSYREFALEDLGDLEKIIITKRTSSPLVFTRNGPDWLINGEFKARQNAMENMLDVIKNIRIDYVPPQTAKENILKSFIRHGIKVELYAKKDKLLKSYYIGSSPADGMGSYFVMDGYDEPLVMSLPTMNGSVHPRFNYTFDEWRDMTVLDFSPKEIKKLEISYPFNRKFSFQIEGGKVAPLHDWQKPITGKENPRLIEAYLNGFSGKEAEYIENQNPRKDSILAQVPFCELRITDTKDQAFAFSFYYHKDPAREGAAFQTGPMDAFNPFQSERFFIQSSWGDFYLGQHQVFRDIFWKYDSFFPKDPAQ